MASTHTHTQKSLFFEKKKKVQIFKSFFILHTPNKITPLIIGWLILPKAIQVNRWMFLYFIILQYISPKNRAALVLLVITLFSLGLTQALHIQWRLCVLWSQPTEGKCLSGVSCVQSHPLVPGHGKKLQAKTANTNTEANTMHHLARAPISPIHLFQSDWAYI